MTRPQRWAGCAVLLLATLTLAHCAGQRRQTQPITLKGSDTMVILGQRWAETYMASHPGAIVQVTGGGSGTGIAALINGTTDICQSSRPMKDEERQQIEQKYGAPPQEIMVAKDGLTIFLNEANPVTGLSLADLKKIYTGAVPKWSAVGGPEAPIILYGRENSSGTYEYFKEHVLEKQDFAASVQTLPGTAAVVSAVAKDPNGIGYGGAAYLKGVKECAVKADGGSAGILPTAENVKSGAYPISRGLFFYLRKAPEGALKEFVEYTLSDSGQKIVTEVGYFPIH
jgi:phosphate transport system substrate-binding protein